MRTPFAKDGNVADTPEVQKGYMLVLVTKQQVIGIGNQRSSLSPCSHIPHPKVTDHRTRKGLCKQRCFPYLQGPPNLRIKTGAALGDVVEGMAVASYEVDTAVGNSTLVADLFCCKDKQLTQAHRDHQQLLTAPTVALRKQEKAFTKCLFIGNGDKPKLLDTALKARAGNPYQCCVYAITAGAAHQAYDQTGILSGKVFHPSHSLAPR